MDAGGRGRHMAAVAVAAAAALCHQPLGAAAHGPRGPTGCSWWKVTLGTHACLYVYLLYLYLYVWKVGR